MTSENERTRIEKLLKVCVEALDSKKANDIKILKLGAKSSITDYFVIASCQSEPQLNALRKELEGRLHEAGFYDVKIDYELESGWAVIDGFDFMVHVFLEDLRGQYALEGLWKDAEVVDISKL